MGSRRSIIKPREAEIPKRLTGTVQAGPIAIKVVGILEPLNAPICSIVEIVVRGAAEGLARTAQAVAAVIKIHVPKALRVTSGFSVYDKHPPYQCDA